MPTKFDEMMRRKVKVLFMLEEMKVKVKGGKRKLDI